MQTKLILKLFAFHYHLQIQSVSQTIRVAWGFLQFLFSKLARDISPGRAAYFVGAEMTEHSASIYSERTCNSVSPVMQLHITVTTL